MFYLVSDQQCFELFVYKFTPVITSDTFDAAKYTYICQVFLSRDKPIRADEPKRARKADTRR